jgi:multiple sugar transport system permease protein
VSQGDKIKRGPYGYIFIAPFFIIFVLFGLYPIVYTFILSFQKWDGFIPAVSVRWTNFRRLVMDKIFYLTVWNTFRIWIINFIPQLTAALVLAAIFSLNRIRGMRFFRAVYYLPNLITAASVGLLFNLLFNGDKSAANYILIALKVKGAPFGFFNNPPFISGLVSYIQWWMWFGYTMIIVLAGITTIDVSIYEAAIVDGASKFKTFTRITMPLINPTLLYLSITSIIGGMQLFDIPATLTERGSGDPQKVVLTTSMYLYNQGFKSHNLGYASTISVGLFCIIALLCAIAFQLMRRRETAYET